MPDKPRLVSLVCLLSGDVWSFGGGGQYCPHRCKAVDNKRETLVSKIESFSPSDWVLRVPESPVSWKAVVTFVEAVMSHKEEAGRVRDLSGEGG